MALPTQGTVLYAIDPADDSVITVGCITNLAGIDTTNEQIETTCLSDQARTYLAGLSTPGTASFDINFDTSDASHMRMRELKVAGTTLQWAVGISDDTAPRPLRVPVQAQHGHFPAHAHGLISMGL